MTYTPIIPTQWNPIRQNINDFLESIVAAFQVQYPAVVRKYWSEVPATYSGEVPLIYLGDIIETILFTGSTGWSASIDGAGLRHAAFAGAVHYVDVAPDNQEANARANSFADYFREVFSANARILPPGIFQPTGLSEGPAFDGPGQSYMHLVSNYTYTALTGDPVTS